MSAEDDRVLGNASSYGGQPDETDTTMSAEELFGTSVRPDLSKAERWGPLLLLDRVGGGGFGEVYRAWDPGLDHEVALKLLRTTASAAIEDPAPSTVVREGQLLARVRHPNVITVHGALEVDGQIGIWMDFLHGRTLDQVVRDEGPMSAAEAAVIGDSLCRAVAAVHRVGLLHRDIKASNVMREAGGRIVLLDFGAGSEAALASTRAGRQRIAGTPLYLAPEIFEGVGPSVQSDIYSLGVLLFYLVTRTYPVLGKSVDDVYAAHQAGRRTLLADVRPDLPADFVAVVERALSPAPEHRQQSAGAMQRDLAGTVAAPHGTAHDNAGVRASGSRTVHLVATVAGGLVSLVALVTLLGYFTSAAFNAHLGIAGDFVSETPVAYAMFGAQNLVPTAVYMASGVLLFYAAGALASMVSLVPGVGRWIERVKQAGRALVKGLTRDDPGTEAKIACAVGALIFGAIGWTFRDLIAAVTSRANDAPLETLAVLHPSYLNTHVLYGLLLDMLVLMLLFVLRRVLRAGSRGRAGLGPVLGLVALAGLGLVFHAIAWRVLYRNEFRQATFEGQTCYVLAGHDDELLVDCPQAMPPRNRVIGRADTRLAFTGRVEQVSNAFTPASSPRPAN